MPLTTQLMGGDFRARISVRDQLQKESDVCVNEIYTINLSRFVNPEETLTLLTKEEMKGLEKKLTFILGLKSYLEFLS